MIVESLLQQKNLWKQYQKYLVIEKWPELMGERIASVTQAEKISKGILFVKVKDSVWAYHLTLLKKQISEKINNFIGGNLIKDIYFFVGDFIKKGTNTSTDCNIIEKSINIDSLFRSKISKLRQIESVFSASISERNK